MTEQDSLSNFDFNKVSKPGKFLKFEAGKPVTIRVLTRDPVVVEKEFENKKTGEVSLSTRFCFVVWNFTDERPQILSAGPTMGKTFQRIGNDDDFGANLQKCDIKISPEGKMLERVYDINVLRHSGSEKQLTKEMITEAAKIDLLKDIEENRGRLSEWEPPKKEAIDQTPPEESEDQSNPSIGLSDEEMNEPLDLSSIPF
jgi:hypothetical protein